MGESKYEVLKLVPNAVKPKAVLIKLPATVTSITKTIREGGLTLPVIFKPDIGERGWMVRKVSTEQDIEKYLSEIKIDFLIQELVNLPLEFGVYYTRFPSEQFGYVTSITGKEFLSVTGDGKKSLKELILEKDRAKIQWATLRQLYKDRLMEILPKGKVIELVSIGNHCLGTKFLNGNHLITQKLNNTFDALSKQIDGFYFGRFDLRCSSLEDLENGAVKIMELNGCGAEPAHIYQSGTSLLTAISFLITHWQNLYRVSRENHERGFPYLSFHEGRQIYNRVKNLSRPNP